VIMDRNWQNLTDPIMRWAAERPNAIALVEGRQSLSYGDLGALMRRATVFLRRNGVAPGLRTGIAMVNGIDHVILLLAMMRMGAVPVELPTGSGAAPILAAVGKYRLATVVTDPDIDLGVGTEPIHIRIDLDTRAGIAPLPPDEGAAAGLDALTIVILSSGTTGVPAGFVSTHRQMLCCIESRGATWPALASDNDIPPDALLVASVRYAYFFHCFLTQLYLGGTIILLPEYAHGIDLLRAIAACPGARCFGTANVCRFLLAAALPDKLLLPDLALFEYAGQPLTAQEKRDFAARVTPNFADNYGSVATGTISLVTAKDIGAKAETVGRPVPGMEVQVVDADGGVLPPGQVGRLRCRGGGMANGLCAEDTANASAEYFEAGWFYPGDLAALDGDGYLVLKGRAGDVVRRQGVEIFSGEIEATLLAHPTVRDAAVISSPSAKVGEALVAFVVSGAEPRHEELARHCRMNLPSNRWPDHVFYIDALPRNAAGKIERPRLRALAEARLAGAANA
jgi:acyl-coenzyme A synthetase/AMP-(fatty) acid ligase